MNVGDTRANIAACGFGCSIVLEELRRLGAGKLMEMVKARNDYTPDIHVASFWDDYIAQFPAVAESLTFNFAALPLAGTPAEALFSESTRQCGFANATEGEVAANFSFTSNVTNAHARMVKSQRRRSGIKTAKKPFRNSKDQRNYVTSLLSIAKGFKLNNRSTKRGTKKMLINKCNFQGYRRESLRNRKKLVTAFSLKREIMEHDQGVIHGRTVRPMRAPDPLSALESLMQLPVAEIKARLIAADPGQKREILKSNVKKVPKNAGAGYKTLYARLREYLQHQEEAKKVAAADEREEVNTEEDDDVNSESSASEDESEDDEHTVDNDSDEND